MPTLRKPVACMEFIEYEGRNVSRIENDGNITPWVHIKQTKSNGSGLFASCKFEAGETIGRYVGFLIGSTKNESVTAAIKNISESQFGDAIIEVSGIYVDGKQNVQSNAIQTQLFGRVLFDNECWKWPGAYIHMCNDAHRTNQKINIEIDDMGYATATCTIMPGSELLLEYGAKWWNEDEKIKNSNQKFSGSPCEYYIGMQKSLRIGDFDEIGMPNILNPYDSKWETLKAKAYLAKPVPRDLSPVSTFRKALENMERQSDHVLKARLERKTKSEKDLLLLIFAALDNDWPDIQQKAIGKFLEIKKIATTDRTTFEFQRQERARQKGKGQNFVQKQKDMEKFEEQQSNQKNETMCEQDEEDSDEQATEGLLIRRLREITESEQELLLMIFEAIESIEVEKMHLAVETFKQMAANARLQQWEKEFKRRKPRPGEIKKITAVDFSNSKHLVRSEVEVHEQTEPTSDEDAAHVHAARND